MQKKKNANKASVINCNLTMCYKICEIKLYIFAVFFSYYFIMCHAFFLFLKKRAL